MRVPLSAPDDHQRDAVLGEIREEYARRTDRFNSFTGAQRQTFDRLMTRRHQAYRDILERAGLLPLSDRKILDVGSGRNEWLVECRQAWGHTGEELCGIELLPERVEKGIQENAYLKLVAGSADQLPWPDNYFDLVHQGMLLSSIPDKAMRERIVAEMRRVTRPAGFVLWYDFVWNPVNRATVPIPSTEVQRLFSGWQVVERRRATLAPPLARVLLKIGEPLVDLMESMRVFNFWELALFRKPEFGG